MKDFLSEYGFAILAAIVVILLIAMCTPVGNLVKNQVMGVIDNFANKTSSKLNAMDVSSATVVLEITGKKPKATISNPTANHTYRLEAKTGDGSYESIADGEVSNGKVVCESKTVLTGDSYEFRVVDAGTNDVIYESGVRKISQ